MLLLNNFIIYYINLLCLNKNWLKIVQNFGYIFESHKNNL